MNQAEAFRSLEEKKQLFLARIPANASKLRARYLQNQVEGEIEAAGKHLQAIYDSDLAIGPDFGPLQACEANPKYDFWLEGIRRHLQNAEAVLAEQPA
jgi:hypothetical protein